MQLFLEFIHNNGFVTLRGDQRKEMWYILKGKLIILDEISQMLAKWGINTFSTCI